MKIMIDLFDRTGNTAKPFKEKGWTVYQIDKKNGQDIMTWDYKTLYGSIVHDNKEFPEVGIIAMIPCDAYALCGNRWKRTMARTQAFKESQALVQKVKEIIDYFDSLNVLKFWMVENPMSDIHKHNEWLGKIRQKFNPCDFAGYDPEPDNSRYNKQTWLWGNFNLMTPKRLDPISKESPIWKNYGGKSERTKEARSITPLGFAYAFAEANK